tara:strand:- start:3711 stop:4259 length:549 start_codon:yes stop_codon:yes gene_type:complete
MYAFLLVGFLVFGGPNIIDKGEETVTIKVVEGKTYLVNVDESGNVLHTYMEITESTDTKDDIDSRVEKAKKEYEALREREKDQIRFIAYDFLSDEVGPLASNHLSDLADHYSNTYANQIVITLGKRPGNEEFLKEKENLLVVALINLSIPAEDIEVRYKWDRGPDPTEFIKVNTTLRKLPST